MRLFRTGLEFTKGVGEVPGEEVWIAESSGWRFYVKHEPHLETWEWIVVDASDGMPLDLGAVVPTKEAAIEACRTWFARELESR